MPGLLIFLFDNSLNYAKYSQIGLFYLLGKLALNQV